MDSRLLLAAAAVAGGLGLGLIGRLSVRPLLWLGASLISGVQAALFYKSPRPFTESSPVTALLCGAVPPLLCAGVIALSRWKGIPWFVGALLGGLLWVVSFLPLFLMSCYVAEWFPGVPGCFF